MEEEGPVPPLPRKQYKRRKHQLKIDNVNDEESETKTKEIDRGVEIFHDFANLDLSNSNVSNSNFTKDDTPKKSTNPFLSPDFCTSGFNVSNEQPNAGFLPQSNISLCERGFDTHTNVGIVSRNSFDTHTNVGKVSRNSFNKIAIKKKHFKYIDESLFENNCLDALISKNLSEFHVDVVNDESGPEVRPKVTTVTTVTTDDIGHVLVPPARTSYLKTLSQYPEHNRVPPVKEIIEIKPKKSLSLPNEIDTEKKSFTIKPPPSRPPPPKTSALTNFKSHTLPASFKNKIPTDDRTKSEIFVSLFDKVVETNDDINDFGKGVIELRKSFQYNDTSTNTGIINSHIVENIPPNIAIEVIVYFDSCKEDEKTLQCQYSWTSSEICSQYLTTIANDGSSLDLFMLINQYIFKFVGFDMYFEENVRLCDHFHVQEFVKRGKIIKLDLIDKKMMTKNLARDRKDDLILQTSFINFGDYFEKPGSLSVSEQGLSVLLESYDTELARQIEIVTNTDEPDFLPDRMIQVIKAISTVLATIDLSQIQNAVKLLYSIRSPINKGNTFHNINVGMVSRNINESFEYEVVPSPIDNKFDREIFNLALEQLTNGIYYLVELYCKSFELKFNFHGKNTLPKSYNQDGFHQLSKIDADDVFEYVDPRSITDKFIVKIESVHRIPSEWKFNFVDFQIEVGLYYGGELLCAVQQCTQSTVDKGFFEHISFTKLIEFDITVRQIPRETKIGFILCGQVSQMHSTPLCWFTKNLYNYEGFLISGGHLFGLLYDVDFDPVATCATNYIHHCDTVILKVDFQVYPIDVLFPQPILILPSDTIRKHDLSNFELSKVQKILHKDLMHLNDTEKSFIWNNRFSLSKFPKALIYVLLSVPSWDAESVLLVHKTLHLWEKVSPHIALKLLEGCFPDIIVREYAISCLDCVSNNEIYDYLPGLVQALKYETHHNSALARFLIKRALSSVRISNYLYWYLKYYVEDIQFCQRYKTVISGLLHVCGRRLRNEFTKQDNLINALSKVTNDVKETKDSLRRSVLTEKLRQLNNELDSSIRIPFDPAIKVCKIIPNDSSYFNSFTVPLKIAFKNEDLLGEDGNIIFKIGDDLRKDLLTLQLFRVMNGLWMKDGLDLKIMLYNVLPTSPYAGLIEIVPNASTLREIHVQYGGVTGSFKDDSLALWLQQCNLTKKLYEKAINNFTASAAGYCVATYILGIGDRHNDNIMITKNGHIFHIDFSKYMGDIQKFGTIKRDRVPFVLTPDMAYVINNGTTPSHNFQKFTEYCCLAFNIIRRNRNKLLNILRLMMYADIAYVSPEADIEYVYHALQLNLSDEEAGIYFSQLIQNSLSSVTPQLNFFIHNVAHMKDSLDFDFKKLQSNSGFTFSNQIQTFKGYKGVHSARVVDFQKRYIPNKHYVFVVNVIQDEESRAKFVFRSYDDFQELHTNITNNYSLFNGIELPQLPPKILIGRSEIREVAQDRRLALDRYLVDLSAIPKIWCSDIMATFLHSYIRDHDEEERFFNAVDYLQDGWKSRIGGKIKVSTVYEKQYLKIFVTHVSNLVPRRIQGLADSYVKSYLLPDYTKHTKRKTKICRRSLNPTFNETFLYNTPHELLKNRILQISVWDQVNLTDKEFLGGVNYYLSHFDPAVSTSCWFNLVDIDVDE